MLLSLDKIILEALDSSERKEFRALGRNCHNWLKFIEKKLGVPGTRVYELNYRCYCDKFKCE